jgi:hypothetical protein
MVSSMWMVRFGTKRGQTVRRSHGETRRRDDEHVPVNFAMRLKTMIVSRLPQAIRIFRTMLLAMPLLAVACTGDDVAWTDPLALSPSGDADVRLMVDSKGRVRMIADTSVSVVPSADAHVCAGSVRTARQDDGTLTAIWWSVRSDSSTALLAAVSPDGGNSWHPAVRVDTADVNATGCSRPAPAIAASGGFVHVAYAMRGSEGVGVFYVHSMNAGKSYEPAVTILYGDRLARTAIASDRETVAVAYEEPSGSAPQIGLAISRDWGHIFRDRIRGSTGVGTAANPEVAVAGREIAVSWTVGSAGANAVGGDGGSIDSNARATRIGRVGRLQ